MLSKAPASGRGLGSKGSVELPLVAPEISKAAAVVGFPIPFAPPKLSILNLKASSSSNKGSTLKKHWSYR